MSSTDKKINLDQAKQWTSNWRNAPTTAARAFLIPIQDLQGLLEEMNSQLNDPNACVRAYLAIDETGEEKLVFVGTQQDRNGVYRDMLPNDDEVGANQDGIWDFTRPCPPRCDDESALN